MVFCIFNTGTLKKYILRSSVFQTLGMHIKLGIFLSSK